MPEARFLFLSAWPIFYGSANWQKGVPSFMLNALLEIGCEEIPARFMPGFLADLKKNNKLKEYEIAKIYYSKWEFKIDDGQENPKHFSYTINNSIDILNKAGLSCPKSLSLSSEALFLWYVLARSDRIGNTMLVNLDLDHIDIDIIEEDKLVFTRGIAYGARDHKKLDKISAEIKYRLSS